MAYIRFTAKRRIRTSQGAIDPGKPGKPRYRTVERDGKRIRLRVVDADSPHFTADFTASFAANVRRARSENRAIDRD